MPFDIHLGRDKADKKRFGDKGLIYLGKGYVTMGQHTSLSNHLYMDVARSHVVLVAGKRGCLTSNTMILTTRGYKPIKDYDEKKEKVYSFNKKSKKFKWENAKLLKYPLKNEKMLKIILKDGREIFITKEHPLLVNYGKYVFWRSGIDLKKGDKIVLPTNLPEIIGKKESVRIARLLGFILSDGTINIRKGEFIDGRGLQSSRS